MLLFYFLSILKVSVCRYQITVMNSATWLNEMQQYAIDLYDINVRLMCQINLNYFLVELEVK